MQSNKRTFSTPAKLGRSMKRELFYGEPGQPSPDLYSRSGQFLPTTWAGYFVDPQRLSTDEKVEHLEKSRDIAVECRGKPALAYLP
jgi:hypothetical protein